MRELLKLLKDGNSRTVEQLAYELHTTPEDIIRQLEFLEYTGALRRLSFSAQPPCGGNCSGCDPAHCKGCIPQNASQNMGEVWEVV